jgi:hypothetical protein
MEIIVPAAGLSSRFPNTRPKYSLFTYSGEMMLKKALEPFLGKYRINIGILKKHDDEFNLKSLILNEIKGHINVVIIDEETLGPADTVFQILEKAEISDESEILIKDCDSFFNFDYSIGNFICVARLCDQESINKPASKSYIISNDQGTITKIIEKSIISDKFCVGGYKFESALLFKSAFKKLKNINSELFVSGIIEICLSDKHIFSEKIVSDYVDVGTIKEWLDYNDKAVIFCDIDGTLIKAQSKNEYHDLGIPLIENTKAILKLIKENNQVFFVTARPESARESTIKTLENIGFINPNIIMGLYNCKRVLINDFNNANPYPRAISINIQRNSDTLSNQLNIKNSILQQI